MPARCLLILQLFTLHYYSITAADTTLYYAPNPGYDPYWIHGEWVFGTTTGTSTKDPNTGSTAKFPYPDVHPKPRALVCGEPCPAVYKKINAKVCAHVVNNIYDPTYAGAAHSHKKGLVDWRQGGVLDRNYDYLRTYNDYCAFKAEQCRTRIYHDMGLIFIHMGPCLKDEEAFPALYYGQDVKNRKLQAMKKYYLQMERKFRGQGKYRPSLAVHMFCACGSLTNISLIIYVT